MMQVGCKKLCDAAHKHILCNQDMCVGLWDFIFTQNLLQNSQNIIIFHFVSII